MPDELMLPLDTAKFPSNGFAVVREDPNAAPKAARAPSGSAGIAAKTRGKKSGSDKPF